MGTYLLRRRALSLGRSLLLGHADRLRGLGGGGFGGLGGGGRNRGLGRGSLGRGGLGLGRSREGRGRVHGGEDARLGVAGRGTRALACHFDSRWARGKKRRREKLGGRPGRVSVNRAKT